MTTLGYRLGQVAVCTAEFREGRARHRAAFGPADFPRSPKARRGTPNPDNHSVHHVVRRIPYLLRRTW